MSAPRARSSVEAHVYMSLHPCASCGDENFDPVVRMIFEDGVLVTRYTGRCRTCRSERDFRFRVDKEWEADEHGPALTPGEPQFGKSDPSEIIDAGQWLRAADLIMAETPSNVLGLSVEEWRERRYLFTAAAESVGEVLKFIPDGADRVPSHCFWTGSGREMLSLVPDRFTRDNLEHQRAIARELAARYRG
jgi:hypothetical protein